MSIKNLQPRFFALLLLILVAGALRVTAAGQITPFSNFSPVGAMALFGGAYFADKWKSYVFPLLTLFLGDVIMMQTVYKAYGNGSLLFEGWIWVYLGFAAMVLIGQLVIRKVRVTNILIACIAAAVAHWLLADFGTWMSSTGFDVTTGLPYTKDWQGLMKCYANGLPFLKNTLLSNVVYCGIFFGLFELMQRNIPALAYEK
ncbi:DUF6580 family putative transport protein [Chitinophaga sp. XS-30]|uniref:DUF6580 family putative transport protein n=1 Tax=Chitinophaga sp. XS-30 TaxID=2604421 RepID=UPI0011DD2770|nr:DUF6580 family putative transport protein [Chitinophaga sp. XS-30]QEH39712.1 hypothetical protein FW415_02070 [Chitinophaga sp. XS-30]